MRNRHKPRLTRALLLALAALGFSAAPAFSEDDVTPTDNLYALYEDRNGTAWCGGKCNGGWCCRIEPVWVQPESAGESPDLVQ